ncbi:MAG: hypothetical protein AB7O96_16110 [Pseudobdellovibrionaceae bacterium]
MSIGETVGRTKNNMQQGFRNTSLALILIILRVTTGLILGLTIALVAQEMMDYGAFALTFVTVVIGAAFYKTSSSWTLPSVLIFDLICVLVAMLLRMYILIAPG